MKKTSNLKDGAFDKINDYLENVPPRQTVQERVNMAGYRQIISEGYSRAKNGTRYIFSDIIGESDEIQKTIFKARRIAGGHLPVLLRGETGCGKELFAQGIHNASTFSNGNFVSINCAAIPENLVESYLFGTVKGAYTGAVDSQGLLEKANGGTLFLDELNSLPYLTQGKLLRVLQEKEASRVGSNKMYPVNCRIISAANQDLGKLMDEKVLRSDLYYRLAVMNIEIPPLRMRHGDVECLSAHFIEETNREYGLQIIGLDDDVLSIFLQYSWPGNVRELKSTVEYMMNFVEKGQRKLSAKDLPDHLHSTGIPNEIRPSNYIGRGTLNEIIEEFRKDLVAEALNQNDWKVTRTAKILGVGRESIYYFIKKYGLEKP